MFVSGPGQTFTVSVFVDPLIADLGWSRTLVSGLYTAGSLTAAAAMWILGRLLDKYGGRTMLTATALLLGLATIAMSAVTHPIHLYFGFAAIRLLGQGALTLIPTTLVALWFVRIRGRATAVAMLGMVASQAAFPPLIYVLISHFDWRQAWMILGFTIWGLLVIPAALVVRRSPESIGVLPDGELVHSAIRPPRELPQAQAKRSAKHIDWTLGEAIRTRTFWLLLFALSAPSLISTALVFHNFSLLAERGVGPATAASVLSVMAPAALLGIFASGFLADKMPNRYVIAISQTILAAAMAFTLAMSQSWQAYVYGGVLGLTSGLHLPISSVIWANYYGRRHLGSIRGMSYIGMVSFSALGPLPFGLLFDITDSYRLPLLVFLALPIASTAAALLARPPPGKR